MRKTRIPAARIALLLLAGLLSAGASFAQEATALHVRTLAATCANCHGTDGRPPQGSVLATLAGLPATLFVERMKGFKAGAPNVTVMHQIAKGFNDAQIDQLASYFAAQAR